MLNKILVPLDGSPLAETALSSARELAQKFQAQITLLRVLPALVIMPELQGQLSAESELMLGLEREAKLYLARLAKRLSAANIPVKTVVLEGNPVAEMILEVAADEAIDLVVMSTHGYSDSKRWAYGSVANKVLQQAPCSIYLVRAKDIPDKYGG
ncbi:MAG: universal stress protein [Anaerolineae bacterium]|nr:universal stress protein [Anaerolineae bacterium]